jgi:hypothetical protein
MQNETLPTAEHVHLERLKLAADVLLSEGQDIPDTLEAELVIYRDRVEVALLRPASRLPATPPLS